MTKYVDGSRGYDVDATDEERRRERQGDQNLDYVFLRRTRRGGGARGVMQVLRSLHSPVVARSVSAIGAYAVVRKGRKRF